MSLISIGSLAVLGAAFGSLLAVAAQKFQVEVDPRVEAILNALPGANCGACGFPGCAGLADAIAAGKAPVNKCPVGGSNVANVISEIMGVQKQEVEHRKVAHVFCQKGCSKRSEYEGISSCRAASTIGGGSETCVWACLGLGDCMAACPFDAISMTPKGVPFIDEDKCHSCERCVAVCPRKIISMVPDHWAVHVDCSSQDRGVAVRETGCVTGCIACGQCERNCPFKAIHIMGDNENADQIAKTRSVKSLAVINYDLCRDCGTCVGKCPTHAITQQYEKMVSKVVIGEGCIGCTICAKTCPVGAIRGEVREHHVVDTEKCIGCGLCLEKCPRQAITRLA